MMKASIIPLLQLLLNDANLLLQSKKRVRKRERHLDVLSRVQKKKINRDFPKTNRHKARTF